MVALLDLVDADEVARHVGGYRAGDLLDEDECEDSVAEQRRIHDGHVTLDHAPGFELLDPFVGRGTAHPHRLPDVGIGLPPVTLEKLENPCIGLIDAFESTHILIVLGPRPRRAPTRITFSLSET